MLSAATSLDCEPVLQSWETLDERRHDGQTVRTGVQVADGLDVPVRRRSAGAFAGLLGGRLPCAHQDVPRRICTADLACDGPCADVPGEMGPPADRSVAG